MLWKERGGGGGFVRNDTTRPCAGDSCDSAVGQAIICERWLFNNWYDAALLITALHCGSGRRSHEPIDFSQSVDRAEQWFLGCDTCLLLPPGVAAHALYSIYSNANLITSLHGLQHFLSHSCLPQHNTVHSLVLVSHAFYRCSKVGSLSFRLHIQ